MPHLNCSGNWRNADELERNSSSDPLFSQSFTYAYVPDSHLLDTVTGPAHWVDNNWEFLRDVLWQKYNRTNSGSTISYFAYTVNAIGQRTNRFSLAGGINSSTWLYDGFGQLTKADDSGTAGDRVYEYDAIGNRKKSADGLILPGTDNYVSNTLNQYTAVPSAPTPPAPGYDPDGNATAYPVPAAPTQNATLAWDGENRLITTTVAGTETTAQYDALSRRIAQTTGATREVTLYDGWNCIAEYEGAANTLHATNLWGTDLRGSPQGAGGVGGLLAVQKHTGPAIGINYPLYDGNGNITEYLNAAGAVVARYKYDPFGRIYASSGTRKDAFPYRFSTKRLDAATGLYYYGYRYYDPVTGRWVSRDPIGESGGTPLYAAANNNWFNAIDILGMTPVTITVTANYSFDNIRADSGLTAGRLGYYQKQGFKESGRGVYSWTIDCASGKPNVTNSSSSPEKFTEGKEYNSLTRYTRFVPPGIESLEGMAERSAKVFKDFTRLKIRAGMSSHDLQNDDLHIMANAAAALTITDDPLTVHGIRSIPVFGSALNALQSAYNAVNKFSGPHIHKGAWGVKMELFCKEERPCFKVKEKEVKALDGLKVDVTIDIK